VARPWPLRPLRRALTGVDALGRDYCDDLEAVASNYCGFLREEGEAALAEVVAGRVQEHLAKYQKKA